MISKDILEQVMQYIESIHIRYEGIIWEKISKKERIFADILTVNEEWWELNDEIKRSVGLSFNKEKRMNAKKENLEDEFVDVVLSLFLLWKSLWIDNLDEAVQRKIQKNNLRWY